jgi:hypothetical protein
LSWIGLKELALGRVKKGEEPAGIDGLVKIVREESSRDAVDVRCEFNSTQTSTQAERKVTSKKSTSPSLPFIKSSLNAMAL